MIFLRNVFWTIAAFGLAASFARAETVPPVTATVARIHWLGKKQLAAETNAARFMGIWNLPDSAKLEAQTLDKLSRWPAAGATNAASALLRPLLDDLVSAESYLEVRAATNQQLSASNQPSTINYQLAVALRLNETRARLWETNLAAALEKLSAIRAVPATGGRHGWSLTKSHAPNRIEFARAGEWTVVGVATDTNALFADFLARIAGDHAPFARPATNFWLEADVDLPRLLSTFNFQLSTFNLQPALHLTATGDGENVLTRGTLDFPPSTGFQLEPWQIPTNLIHQPLIGFAAVRGIAPWLAKSKILSDLQLPAPNQFFCWGHKGGPFETYFAAPLPDASNQVHRLADRLASHANPWLATNGEGNFSWENNLPGLVWHDAFLISPFLKPIVVNQRDFVFGGLYPFAEGDPNPPPAETLRTLLNTTNLVYYHSELTGPRLEDGLFIYQLFRLVFHKAQLPADAAGTHWLKNTETQFGFSVTTAVKTGDNQLAFTRKSTVGLTALELHLLADWLESPQFPRGLHTLLAPPDK